MVLTTTPSGPAAWVLSQALLLLHYHLDNGGNVCGLEFNYNNDDSSGVDCCNYRSNDQEDITSLLRGDLVDSEVLYDAQMFRQLFLGFKVKTEEGR